MSIELKTASGGSVTLVPEDGVSNVAATVKHESGVLASEQFALSNDLGVGQTWQDVAASRSAGVTYTNTTGKPIVVNVTCIRSAATSPVSSFVVDGVTVNRIISTSGVVSGGETLDASSQVIVPNGSTYAVDGTGSLRLWSELR